MIDVCQLFEEIEKPALSVRADVKIENVNLWYPDRRTMQQPVWR